MLSILRASGLAALDAPTGHLRHDSSGVGGPLSEPIPPWADPTVITLGITRGRTCYVLGQEKHGVHYTKV